MKAEVVVVALLAFPIVSPFSYAGSVKSGAEKRSESLASEGSPRAPLT